MVPDKKLGRPTDNPKKTRITIRLDDDTFNILENYCKKEGLNYTDVIRKQIKKLDK